jgi:hypothetical protein
MAERLAIDDEELWLAAPFLDVPKHPHSSGGVVAEGGRDAADRRVTILIL